MKILKVTLPCIALLGLMLSGCGSSSNSNNTLGLEAYLKTQAAYLHRINGFYIVGTNQTPSTESDATAEEMFDLSVKLFSSFLDQDEDGVIDTSRTALADGLAKYMLYVNAHRNTVDAIAQASSVGSLYTMAMNSDEWPFIKAYTGKKWAFTPASINGVASTSTVLNSSTWRPPQFNAAWEEVFHTVTEAYSRFNSELSFGAGTQLRQYMDNDIAAGIYEIKQQVDQEAAMGMEYDKGTAVNEYIHQIWAIQYSSTTASVHLSADQKLALELMKSHNVPMTVNPNYSKTLGERLK